MPGEFSDKNRLADARFYLRICIDTALRWRANERRVDYRFA